MKPNEKRLFQKILLVFIYLFIIAVFLNLIILIEKSASSKELIINLLILVILSIIKNLIILFSKPRIIDLSSSKYKEYYVDEPQLEITDGRVGKYTITVQGIDEEGLLIDGPKSIEKTFEIHRVNLPAPKLSIEKNKKKYYLKWQKIIEAAAFIVNINGEEYEIQDETQFELPKEPGKYVIYVTAVGNPYRTYPSSPSKIEYVVFGKLGVTEPNLEGNKFTWKPILGATNYIVRTKIDSSKVSEQTNHLEEIKDFGIVTVGENLNDDLIVETTTVQEKNVEIEDEIILTTNESDNEEEDDEYFNTKQLLQKRREAIASKMKTLLINDEDDEFDEDEDIEEDDEFDEDEDIEEDEEKLDNANNIINEIEPEVLNANSFPNLLGALKTFDYKFKMASTELQERYVKIKNALLKYKRVKSRISKTDETFRIGYDVLAKINIIGKTLRVFLALDTEKYDENKYHHKFMGDKSKYAKVPMLIKIKSNLACKKVVTLIEDLAENRFLQLNNNYEYKYYDKDFIMNSQEKIFKIGLEGLLREKVIFNDELEIGLDNLNDLVTTITDIENKDIEKHEVKIYVDELSSNFAANEVVNLNSLKERNLIPETANYLNIISRGSIDKSLNVYANEFTDGAIKMIVLSGGNAFKIQYK